MPTATAPVRDTRNKGVTRKAVAVAAQQVLDDVGIDRLSMRLVATRLGVSPMALYNHVTGKDELLELVASHLRTGIVVDEELSAKEQLHALLAQLAQLGARHPRLLENPLALVSTTPEALALPLRILALLQQLGLEAVEVRRTFNALAFLVTGAAASLRATSGEGVATMRVRERALRAAAPPEQRELVRELAALPRTNVVEMLADAVDQVLDRALPRP